MMRQFTLVTWMLLAMALPTAAQDFDDFTTPGINEGAW